MSKGSRTFHHDLFKLGVARYKRNTSWKHKAPTLIDIEHAHIFHSVNDNTGKPNEYCVAVGGHFHKVVLDFSRTVEREVDVNGRKSIVTGPYTECGPPLKFVSRLLPNGRVIRELKNITFERDDVDEQGKALSGTVVDDHRHELIYIDSEEMTSAGRQKLREDQRAAVQGMMEGPGSRQPSAAAKLQESAARGEQIAAGKPADPPA